MFIGIGTPIPNISNLPGQGGAGIVDPDFKFTIETTTTNETFSTPIESSAAYLTDIEVDWGDGNNDSYTGTTTRGTVQHVYAAPGTYQVSVSRNNDWGFYSWNGYVYSQLAKIKSIDNWGTQQWLDFEFFWDKRNTTGGASVLDIAAKDTPDFSNLVNTVGQYMFTKVTLTNSGDSMKDWDVSGFLNLNTMFFNCVLTGMPDDFCSTWDMSNNANFSYMFNGSTYPNMNLNNWDTSSGTNFTGMFTGNGMNSGVQVGGWPKVSGGCSQIFYKSNNPNSNYVENVGGWDISGVTSFQYGWVRQGINSNNVANQTVYGEILRGWTGWDDATSLPTRSLPSNVTMYMQATQCPVVAQDAKNYLINTLGWTFTDGGNVP